MRSPSAEEVSDGVYAYIQPDGSWYINNTGFLVGGGGVISIDSCATQRRTRALLAAVASVTDLPVRTLINTHHHGDHTYGNYLFGGATIVAHERCRDGVLASGLPANLGVWTDVDWGIPELAPPFLTYADAVTVWSGDLKCDVRYVGMPAHTTNDSLIWLPDRSVLFAGDLAFSGGTPFLLMGSVEGAIEVLERVVRPLGALTIVPGHGPVSGPAVLDEMLGYLRFVLDVARRGMAAGLSPLDAAREADLGAS
jgi:cyclase